MKFKSSWNKSLILLSALTLGALNASAATPLSDAQQATSNSVYYVGTRTFKTRIGWTVSKMPLALTIQVNPETSQIRESLVGGMMGELDGGGRGGNKVFTPMRGTADLFHIQFEDVEGSGTLQTSSRAILSVATTAQEFLRGLQWQWKFEVGPEHIHVDGVGQFEPGFLHIKGTVRNGVDRYLINYADEYKEVSFDEYAKMRDGIRSGAIR